MASSSAGSATLRRARPNLLRAPSAKIDSSHVAVLRLRIKYVGIGRISLSIEAVAAANAEPVGIHNARIGTRLAGSGPRTVILQAAVDVIRFAHVRGDRVKLRAHDRVDEFPRVALIVSHVQAAIVADAQMFAILWIDPDRVMIAVRDSRL